MVVETASVVMGEAAKFLDYKELGLIALFMICLFALLFWLIWIIKEYAPKFHEDNLNLIKTLTELNSNITGLNQDQSRRMNDFEKTLDKQAKKNEKQFESIEDRLTSVERKLEEHRHQNEHQHEWVKEQLNHVVSSCRSLLKVVEGK